MSSPVATGLKSIRGLTVRCTQLLRSLGFEVELAGMAFRILNQPNKLGMVAFDPCVSQSTSSSRNSADLAPPFSQSTIPFEHPTP